MEQLPRMINEPPAPRPCSMCGQILNPTLMGTSIDSNYNTVHHYTFRHMCPAQAKKYEDRLNEINNSTMSPEQRRNAAQLAGYMNAWGS